MISALRSGGLIVTYRCSSACRHCLYRSSPVRDSSYIEPKLLKPLLQCIRELGCRSLHIGGGEPFQDFEALVRTVEIMSETGIAVDYLETNAVWVTDDSETREKLSILKRAGCGTVMASVCPFHIEFTPLENVDTLIRACRETGMGYFLWQDQYYHELATLDKSRTHSHRELKEVFGESYVAEAAGRYGLTLNGRALSSFSSMLPGRPAEDIARDHPGGCRELLETGHFHVDLYGLYTPPGCIGFAVGWEDLGTHLDEDRYKIFLVALKKGIAGLFAWARENAGFGASPAGYVSKCHLCLDIRSSLIRSAEADGDGESCRDLGPREFYLVN